MKWLLRILLFCLVTDCPLFAQPLRLEWQRTFGGIWIDICNAAIQTSDSGFIMVGYTTSSDGDVTGYHADGLQDVWVVKTDRSGTLEWQRALGGLSITQFRGIEFGYSVVEAPDGGYVVAGTTTSN